MILSDHYIIRKQLKNKIISLFKKNNIQPNGYDCTLSSKFLILDPSIQLIDTREEIEYVELPIDKDFIILPPKCFILGATNESFEIPNGLVAEVNTKSSLARLGLMVHLAGGFIDSGFKGNITLEIANLSDKHIKLYINDKVCQLIFHEALPSDKTYGKLELNSKYQDSKGVVGSKINKQM